MHLVRRTFTSYSVTLHITCWAVQKALKIFMVWQDIYTPQDAMQCVLSLHLLKDGCQRCRIRLGSNIHGCGAREWHSTDAAATLLG